MSTLRDISEKTGLSVSFLSMAFNGKRRIGLQSAKKIAEYLQISLAEAVEMDTKELRRRLDEHQ